jgi:hypothetical protein
MGLNYVATLDKWYPKLLKHFQSESNEFYNFYKKTKRKLSNMTVQTNKNYLTSYEPHLIFIQGYFQ